MTSNREIAAEHTDPATLIGRTLTRGGRCHRIIEARHLSAGDGIGLLTARVDTGAQTYDAILYGQALPDADE